MIDDLRNGEKWFASNARYAAFLIVVAVTDPGAAPYRRMSMFIVPADTPGITAGHDGASRDESKPEAAGIRTR